MGQENRKWCTELLLSGRNLTEPSTAGFHFLFVWFGLFMPQAVPDPLGYNSIWAAPYAPHSTLPGALRPPQKQSRSRPKPGGQP